MQYDTPFVFAEVNADRVNWELDDSAETSTTGIERHGMFRSKSTENEIGYI